ncbi:type II/IV secretion system ATPase subunit [Candidatus Woesearchaeota archaeon]|nr:type II/IV secretion system ATPase subunit [Candidatus Woesearchaeota archaeon]
MAEPAAYEIIREGEDVILRIDYEGYVIVPSIEDNAIVMARTLDVLTEVGHVTRIVFVQKRDYEYEGMQVELLLEIAEVYKRIIKMDWSYAMLATKTSPALANMVYATLQNIVYNLLKSDPIGAYVELVRLERRLELHMEKEKRPVQKQIEDLLDVLDQILKMLEGVQLIQLVKEDIPGYHLGNREIYRKVFNATIKPDFTYTKLLASPPSEGTELASYQVEDTDVTIYALPETIQYLYHMIPPEFRLSEEKYQILDAARRIMAEHKPKKSEFVDPQRMRSVFEKIGIDLIEELAKYYNVRLSEKEILQLTQILIRYTVGFGLLENLLADQKIQDITINSPMGHIPMFIVHSDFVDCRTNITPTPSEAESWASKLRMISGRPLDEANPILDTELELPGARARVAVIGPPLNPTGLGYAFRRHRDKPWTLPLFMKSGMISPLAAGVLSFLVDGARTMLIAGTRSAGKTSLLAALMVEIMRKFRLISIEDTLELPTTPLRKLGYNIQSMKVASALTTGTTEVSASEGIRSTLRLGDSSLIVGEVRSEEARALYEAMRVGALANVVAGTIHGDSPYGVFDRVCNDLQVPRTSFKATDIIVVANPVRSADGLHRWRRVTEITEVRKLWDEDPVREHGFLDLMKYDSKTDSLQPTPELLNGDSEILKSIAGNVKDWAGNWDAVWDNIVLRADCKKLIVDIAQKTNNPDLLEAEFVLQCNDQFHRYSDEVKEETGTLDTKRIYAKYEEWVKRSVKKGIISQQLGM